MTGSIAEHGTAPELNRDDGTVKQDPDDISYEPDAKGYDESNEDPQRISPMAQHGVQAVEAITLNWSKGWLYTAYASMWLIYLVNAFQSSITSNLAAYIASDFEDAPLVTVIGTVSSIMATAMTMPIARMLNVWDRGNGFLFLAAIATLGMILSASCNSLAVYCAAQVFYYVGFQGLIFCVDVITLDTSTLRDRGLAYAFTSSPYIISAFAGPKAAEGFNDYNWRWGYGCFAIILPFVCIPLYGTLLYNKKKAIASGALVQPVSDKKSVKAWLWDFIIEFDLAGVILLAGGMSLFLLPFIIAGSTEDQWAAPHIIAMLVVGFVLLVGFAVFERYVAPRPFIPYSVLRNRTILGACLLDLVYQIAYYCWDDYFSSYLQVVYNRSLADAGYIGNIFDVVSGVWLLGVGYCIRRTCRFRWMLYWSVPLYILGEGLLIYFRKEGTNIGYIIMCQILMAIGGGTIIIVEQVAILSVPSHNDAASALAILEMFGTVGDAVGASVSGAIWTNLFPNYLQNLLPAESVGDWEDIYDSLDVQLSYPVGNATRTAISEAYGDTQTWMVTAGTIFMAFSLICIFVIRDVKLDTTSQVKGLLF